jgi:hypothetical protein
MDALVWGVTELFFGTVLREEQEEDPEIAYQRVREWAFRY